MEGGGGRSRRIKEVFVEAVPSRGKRAKALVEN